MTSAIAPSRSIPARSSIGLLARTWLLIAVVDGSWAVVLTLAYGRSVVRLWQGVAAAPFGPTMLDGGIPTMLAGIAVHFMVALTWSTVFLVLATQSARLRQFIGTGKGVAIVAAVYGPAIWIVMSAIVVPLATGMPVAITYRWWIQLAGHVVFVGLPIVWSIARGITEA